MNKITFFLIGLLPKKIQHIIILKLLQSISSLFGFSPNISLKISDSKAYSTKEDFLIIKLKNGQEIVQPKNGLKRLDNNSLECIPPEIRGFVIYAISNKIMNEFSKKLPRPYHQNQQHLN